MRISDWSSDVCSSDLTPFDACDGPVLQVVFSGGTAKAWEEGTAGLSARDIAMNVALPEVDGRLLTRAVSFKGAARWDAATQRSEEHTSELQSLMRNSYAVLCLNKKKYQILRMQKTKRIT